VSIFVLTGNLICGVQNCASQTAKMF